MTLGNPDSPEIPPRQPPPISTEWMTSGGTPKKPGFRTSEFWISLAALFVGAYLSTHGQDVMGGILMTGVVSAYGISRGIAKR